MCYNNKEIRVYNSLSGRILYNYYNNKEMIVIITYQGGYYTFIIIIKK